jgi:hypothetical protein
VSSLDPTVLSRELKASQQRYAELMEFVVKTTQQLEGERADKEQLESRAQADRQAMAVLQQRLEQTETKLAQAREEAKRAAAASSKSATEDSQLRQRGGAPTAADDVQQDRTLRKLAAATTAASSSSSSTSSSSSSSSAAQRHAAAAAASPSTALLTEQQKAAAAAAGLNLPLWQIALLALVCFVLGRIFG